MKRLYWQNTYLMQHQAKITAIGQDEFGTYVRLDETIFHPQGGGQPSDEGTINGIKIIKLKDFRDINDINHYLEDSSSFKIGDQVELKIDSEKRLEYAALHTAGHITAAVLRTSYHCTEQTSANHFPKQAKVEFKTAIMPNKESITAQANSIIANAKMIYEQYDPSGLRCITIDGLCTDPCSGTHLSDTGQIMDYLIRKIENKKERLIVGYDAKFRGKE